MFAPRPVVYFFSDFGSQGPYVGQVEAVVIHQTPAHFINLISNAPATDPFHSAYLIAALFEELPVKSGYMLAVVDPGVGSNRRAITFNIGSMTFLGPDNGLFSRLIARHEVKNVAILNVPSTKISNSFHARDWFAPELVRLINGERMDLPILEATEVIGIQWPDSLQEVIYVDHYGNLVTGISAGIIPTIQNIFLDKIEVCYAPAFSAVSDQSLFWYENSMGLVEIAANSTSAAELTGLGTGCAISMAEEAG